MTNSSMRDGQEDLAYSVPSPCCERLRCAKGRPVVAQQQGAFFCALMAGHAAVVQQPRMTPRPRFISIVGEIGNCLFCAAPQLWIGRLSRPQRIHPAEKNY